MGAWHRARQPHTAKCQPRGSPHTPEIPPSLPSLPHGFTRETLAPEWTASQTTPPALQQATAPSQPNPTYPLPIPKEKEVKALELYKRYRDAKLKEKMETSQIEPQATASHRGGYLTVPGPPTAQSLASYASSKHSLATSAYDAITDLSSVVSFDDDDDDPASASVKMEGKLMSFDGKVIEQRRRKKLSPVARTKAALVRYLGSCQACRSRKVKCPLEHHDIDLLERLRQQRLATKQPKADNASSSSISSSSQQTATSIHAWPNTGPAFSQTDTLIGVGEGIGGDLNATLGNLDTSQLDIQSPGGAAYGEISLDLPALSSPSLVAPDVPDFGPNPYSSYQDGQMLVLGAHRSGLFWCRHLDRYCFEFFETDEELQVHFELAHFSFTRIRPAHRFVCLTCIHFNNDIMGPCSNCHSVGTIELWIYGNFIRNPAFQRYAPDAQDFANGTPTTLFSSTYTTSNIEHWDDNRNFDGYPNTNTDNYDFQGGGGNYGGSQYEEQPSNYSSYSTHHFQGNMFNNTRQRATTSHGDFSARVVYGKAQQVLPHQKHIVFLLMCLLAIFILSSTHTHGWIFAKARLAFPRLAKGFNSHVPLVGFLGIFGSFGTCFSVKCFTALRLQRMRCVSFTAL